MKENYSDLKNRLEEIIEALQGADLDLDEAIKLHGEGQKILKKLDDYLAGMEEKIRVSKK